MPLDISPDLANCKLFCRFESLVVCQQEYWLREKRRLLSEASNLLALEKPEGSYC